MNSNDDDRRAFIVSGKEDCTFLGHLYDVDLYHSDQHGMPTVIAHYGPDSADYTSLNCLLRVTALSEGLPHGAAIAAGWEMAERRGLACNPGSQADSIHLDRLHESMRELFDTNDGPYHSVVIEDGGAQEKE